jgi:hypothetical protein
MNIAVFEEQRRQPVAAKASLLFCYPHIVQGFSAVCSRNPRPVASGTQRETRVAVPWRDRGRLPFPDARVDLDDVISGCDDSGFPLVPAVPMHIFNHSQQQQQNGKRHRADHDQAVQARLCRSGVC